MTTLTGCVSAGDQGAAGTSGAATTGTGTTGKGSRSARSSTGATHYMLTNVTPGTGTGAAGTTGGTTPSGDVMLMGSNLKAHVGHKVEVHGKWDAAGGTSAKTGGGTSGTGGTLHVTSVKMISSTCSGQ